MTYIFFNNFDSKLQKLYEIVTEILMTDLLTAYSNISKLIDKVINCFQYIWLLLHISGLSPILLNYGTLHNEVEYLLTKFNIFFSLIVNSLTLSRAFFFKKNIITCCPFLFALYTNNFIVLSHSNTENNYISMKLMAP